MWQLVQETATSRMFLAATRAFFLSPSKRIFFHELTIAMFSDSYGNKPWADKSDNAMKQFWAANTTWLPTWGAGPARGMTVKYVKMWQEGKC